VAKNGCVPGVSRLDRRAAVLLLIFLAFAYSYFFQGGGWNQNAHFDTVRAIAERGTLEITPYAGNTGDVVTFGDRVFSNKPPGLGLLGSPVYFTLYRVERALGVDPEEARIVNLNAHIVTFWVSGLPAALLGIALYCYFRRQGETTAGGLLLAGAFGLGITRAGAGRTAVAIAGALLGCAVVAEYLVIPLAGLYLAYLWWRFRGSRIWLHFLWGPAAAGLVILACNYWAYGSPWTSIYSIYTRTFTADGLVLGVLGPPDLRRLYWLSFHPYRGLFYCCPVFVASLAGLLLALKSRSVHAAGWLAVTVCTYFLLFNLTFNGWTGGWGIGPRYLIPALPFLYSFTHYALKRFRLPSMSLMALSVFLMVGVTAVCVMIPAENFGPPIDINPTVRAVSILFRDHVSISRQSVLEYRPGAALAGGLNDAWDSYNLGEVWGLEGWMSLMPLAVAAFGFCAVCRAAAGRHSPEA
jgi:hypothetical protein